MGLDLGEGAVEPPARGRGAAGAAVEGPAPSGEEEEAGGVAREEGPQLEDRVGRAAEGRVVTKGKKNFFFPLTSTVERESVSFFLLLSLRCSFSLFFSSHRFKKKKKKKKKRWRLTRPRLPSTERLCTAQAGPLQMSRSSPGAEARRPPGSRTGAFSMMKMALMFRRPARRFLRRLDANPTEKKKRATALPLSPHVNIHSFVDGTRDQINLYLSSVLDLVSTNDHSLKKRR